MKFEGMRNVNQKKIVKRHLPFPLTIVSYSFQVESRRFNFRRNRNNNIIIWNTASP